MATPEVSQPNPEGPTEQDVVLSAVLLMLARQNQHLSEKANLDPLTGVGNREALAKSYAGLQTGERQRTGDTESPSGRIGQNSVLMVDIDHFKQVNDTRGHARGDRVLRETAKLLEDKVRKRDVVARIGGEEFAVLLPRARSDQAMRIAEIIRQAAERDGDVTLSIGVAGLDLNEPLEDNLVRADMALYDAKEHGRNRTVSYEEMIVRNG